MQILLNGYPEKVSNSKKKIFEEYYSVLFNDSSDFMDISVELAKKYQSILNKYNELTDKYKYYEQKIFYIIYLSRCFDNNDIIKYIDILEDELKKYKTIEEISPARKLIQKGFKIELDKRIIIDNGEPIMAIDLKGQKN